MSVDVSFGMPDRKRLEHALLLIARQHGASPDVAKAATEALARWRAREPANEQAAQAAMALRKIC